MLELESIHVCKRYVSVNWIIIGSSYGLSPVRSQAITRLHQCLNLNTMFLVIKCISKCRLENVKHIVHTAQMLTRCDAIRRHRSWSALTQVMTCLTTISHYRTKCWLIIKCVLWHSHKGKYIPATHGLTTPSPTKLSWTRFQYAFLNRIWWLYRSTLVEVI